MCRQHTFPMASSADQKTRRLYGFGPFRVDPEKELLLREDEAIPIAPKAFQVLLVLMRNSKQVVTKDDLLKTIWPDAFVEESNLSRNIFLLRKALGESPQDHQYIVTVPGRGYRLAEDVQLVPECELDIVAASHAKVQVQVEEGKSWGWIAVVAVLVAALGTVSLRLFVHRSPALTETDTIVLADFNNSTGDPVFDGTLRQGLAIQLEQSPFLKIVDDGLLQRDLRLMNLQPGVHITRQIAHDVCMREGAAATIDGAIASLGKSYVITLQAITCQEGRTVAREQIQAEDKEQVLNALGSAATAMRRKLGESLNSIQRLNRPLEQVTTPSLEALQNYTEGLSVMGQGHFLAAVPLFQRAVAIDPNFALAYYYLGVAYENAGDAARSREYSKEAFDRIGQVSEYERDYIASGYYYWVTGEFDKVVDAYQSGVRSYPRMWGFHNDLSTTYIDLGQFEDGLKEGSEAVRLQPHVEPPYRRELDAYICLGRLREANHVATEVRALGIDGARIHQRLLELAYVEDDQAAVAREIQWFAGRPEEYLSLGLQAADRNLHGQRRESRMLYQRAVDTAMRLGLKNVASDFEDADARADALAGNCSSIHWLGRPALALALCGDAAQAERIAAETSRLFPNGTIWNAVQLPEIRAAIALNSGQPARSVDLLASASPFERAYPDVIYVRGLAYLRMGRGEDASAEFQKIVDHKGTNWASDWRHPYWGQVYSLSYLGMARGFALAGDAAKAKKVYQDFFRLWKDSDLPVLKRARAEYAKLNWP